MVQGDVEMLSKNALATAESGKKYKKPRKGKCWSTRWLNFPSLNSTSFVGLGIANFCLYFPIRDSSLVFLGFRTRMNSSSIPLDSRWSGILFRSYVCFLHQLSVNLLSFYSYCWHHWRFAYKQTPNL